MLFVAPDLAAQETHLLEQIDGLRSQLRHYVAEPRRWTGSLRRQLIARAVQGSNSIEGYVASLDDVIAVVEDDDPVDAGVETVRALRGYRDGMTYVLQLAEEPDLLVIDRSLIASLHFMLMRHDLAMRPGRLRQGSIFVRREPDGAVVYEGPPAEEVPALLDELVAALAGSDAVPLVQAAMAHLNLVMIHPFRDGNGRMARCLQTLVLARARVVAPVFSSIEEYLGQHTDAYYAVLAEVGGGAWAPACDARPWVGFCLHAHLEQAQTLLRRVRLTEELWRRCADLAASRRLPERMVGPLCDAARGLRLRNASYRVAVTESSGDPIEVAAASRDLRTLVEAGLLVPTGQTRGRTYRGAPLLADLYAEVREATTRSG